MLKIRLQRVGRKHEPSFRLVLTDSKNSTKSGKSLEILGNYDARHSETSVFKADRISHWMSVGAQVSPTVHNLLITKKIISGKKINNLPLKKAIVKPAALESTGVAKEAPAEAKIEVATPVADVAETKTTEEAPAPEAEPVAEVVA
jgi:small subunit ribosomal protein S16